MTCSFCNKTTLMIHSPLEVATKGWAQQFTSASGGAQNIQRWSSEITYWWWEELLHHQGCIKTPIDNGINYQPQLVSDSRISEPSTVSLSFTTFQQPTILKSPISSDNVMDICISVTWAERSDRFFLGLGAAFFFPFTRWPLIYVHVYIYTRMYHIRYYICKKHM